MKNSTLSLVLGTAFSLSLMGLSGSSFADDSKMYKCKDKRSVSLEKCAAQLRAPCNRGYVKGDTSTNGHVCVWSRAGEKCVNGDACAVGTKGKDGE